MTEAMRPTSAPAATRPRPERKAGQPPRRTTVDVLVVFALLQAVDGRLGAAFHQAFALDQPLGDVARDLVGDGLDSRSLGEHDAAGARILDETVGAAIARHDDMADSIDPQARLQTGRDGEIEQIDVGGHLRKQRLRAPPP